MSNLQIEEDVNFESIKKLETIVQKVINYELSRYACYLIVQNGDSLKE